MPFYGTPTSNSVACLPSALPPCLPGGGEATERPGGSRQRKEIGLAAAISAEW